ncbi:unnamed protein product [Anisakis simplex]|uniref:Succinate dehydrogenase assembly factor 4, mitochondrial n=1 Tax=Anisakis simplex TaxID=6269 RepID=A0A0M3JW75_ANISI|nr:unnamed protein product [Anisakis simplex]
MLRRALYECDVLGVRIVRSLSSDAKVKKGKMSAEDIVKKKTPKGKLDDVMEKPYEDPYLPRHPGGVNPVTGEINGPAGPEPTRYGDWERKGRVSDF